MSVFVPLKNGTTAKLGKQPFRLCSLSFGVLIPFWLEENQWREITLSILVSILI